MPTKWGSLDASVVESAIQAVAKRAVEEVVTELVTKAKENLDRKIPEIVSGLCISLMKRVSLESCRDELVVHIQMGDEDARHG